MNALVSIFASTTDGETTSSTIFYVVGGVLAVWAVLVSLAGIAKPDFPEAAARGVMLVTLLLVLGAMSSAVITS